jgi:hypothetical protein
MPSALVREIPCGTAGGADLTVTRPVMSTVVAVMSTVVAVMSAVVAVTVVAVMSTVVARPMAGAVPGMMPRMAEARTVLLRTVLRGAVMAVCGR